MDARNSLIAELEAAVHEGSRDKRVATLRRVTDLFLHSAHRFNDEQIGLFDDVLLHLVKRVQNKALAELSARLAPVGQAPVGVIQRLARHDEIAVAGPVLALSTRLSDDDLIEVAATKSQGHLLAISGRAPLVERVTDALVERGDRDVDHKLANNPRAAFSAPGFATLVGRAESDDILTEKLGQRLDIPPRLLRHLLLKATEAVRSRLLAFAPVETRDEIHRVLAAISSEVSREATAPRDFARAQALAQTMQQENLLNAAIVVEFAKAHKYEEMVASLARLCSTPIGLIERLMQNVRCDGLLVACKAAEFKWPEVSAILTNRFDHHSVSTHELHTAKAEFAKLKTATAGRVLRFWQVHGTVAGSADREEPEAEDLQVEMLRALRIDPALLDATDPATVQDLERRCGECGHGAECRYELSLGRAADRYRDFCPNADLLDRLKTS